MGEVILKDLVDAAGLADRVRVTSSGTGDWHVGEKADPRTIATLRSHGYDGDPHRASVFDPRMFPDYDLVLAADDTHVRALRHRAKTDTDRDKIRLLREFDPEAVRAGTLETADPYYGSEADFEQCFTDVEAACRGIVDDLRNQLAEKQDSKRP